MAVDMIKGTAKGYCRVAGDGALQSGSFNVASSSKQGTGFFRVVWNTDFTNTLYTSSMICEQASALGNIQVRAIATTHLDSQSFDTSGSTQDAAIQVSAWGDQ